MCCVCNMQFYPTVLNLHRGFRAPKKLVWLRTVLVNNTWHCHPKKGLGILHAALTQMKFATLHWESGNMYSQSFQVRIQDRIAMGAGFDEARQRPDHRSLPSPKQIHLMCVWKHSRDLQARINHYHIAMGAEADQTTCCNVCCLFCAWNSCWIQG